MTNKHVHHIIPKHLVKTHPHLLPEGGIDSPLNLAKVTTQEHAEAHLVLFMIYRKREDYLAYCGILGYLGKEDIIKELQKKPKSEYVKSVARETMYKLHDNMDAEQKRKRSVRGGKAGLKTLISKYSKEQRSEWARQAQKKSSNFKRHWIFIEWIDNNKIPSLVLGRQGGADCLGKSLSVFNKCISIAEKRKSYGIKSITLFNGKE